ncbi:MAG: hypothetical protein AB4063_19615, partial [Crocosphaera sp.]
EKHGTSTDSIDNFRLIDQDQSQLYPFILRGTKTLALLLLWVILQEGSSWELVDQRTNNLIGRPPYPFLGKKERKESLETLQACVNEQGFHLIEHILLRPRYLLAEPLSAFPPDQIPLETIREPKEAQAKDDYDLTQASTSGKTGFELFKEGDRYYFHFNDCQGNALFYSEAYTSKAARNGGVSSVIRNSILKANYSQKQSLSGEECPIYFFTLQAKNRQEIGRSRYFAEKWKLEACLTWFQHNVHQYAEEFGVKWQESDELPLLYLPLDDLLPLPKIPATFPDLPSNFDPYSFRVSVILPNWPTRFRDTNFRPLLERTLHLEAPAHVALDIYWLNVEQMHHFEEAYGQWLEQLHLKACEQPHDKYGYTLNHLIQTLSALSNSYFEGTLHDCEVSDFKQNPIILNQTQLGTIK